MSQIRCPFCHEYINSTEFPQHEAEHMQLREDGQQNEYVTLPPEEREQGDLEGVPRAYIHSKCGAGTGMPEEIIRTYLVNPWTYLADKTFCTGCGTHVPLRECNWIETGEDLQTYTDRLRSEKPEMRPGLLMRIVMSIAKLFG